MDTRLPGLVHELMANLRGRAHRLSATEMWMLTGTSAELK